ncbi:hypothetical protein ACSMXN_18025 [Jatrophihabitans sp. DSM 45814]
MRAELHRLARRFRDGTSDAGTTMAELVTAMALMTVFMTIFTTSVALMYRSINKVTSLSDSATQLNQAFVRLDREVRYAAAVSQPGITTNGGWYVELKTTNTGATVCTQFRVNPSAKQLQRRTWSVTSAGAATNITSWIPLASGVTNGNVLPGAANPPFVLTPPSATFTYQTLGVRLLVSSGSGDAPTTSVSAVTYTALNSTVATTSTDVCTEVARP